MKKGAGKIGTVVSWVFAVFCFLTVLVYGISIGSVLLLLLGVAALPIKPIRNLWKKLPIKGNWIKPVLLAVLFVFSVNGLPSNETATIEQNQATEITAGITSAVSQNDEVKKNKMTESEKDSDEVIPTKVPEITEEATPREKLKSTSLPSPTKEPIVTEIPLITDGLIATPTPELVQMPYVIGLTTDEAVALLDAVSTGFTVIYEEDYSDDYASGIVMKQYPNSSTSVSKSMTITLTVSAGVETVKLPNVYNLSLNEAKETLASKGYTTVVEYQNSAAVPDGCIIGTYPERFEMVKQGSSIVLYVSSGDGEADKPSPTPKEIPKATATPTPIVNHISIRNIPKYSGNSYSVINNNIPYFENKDLTTGSFEYYSELDSLGRCGVTLACVGKDIMPTEDRGSIGQVKPSGWQTIKYDIVDGKYLYNRCHLIGFQLTGENANVKNLITGTRSMNVDGMLPFENMVADYVKETGNHVMYRVTPLFEGNNLVATGVLMEAKSVEDSGDGILFNVFVYNVQSGIVIDYLTGNSELEEAPVITEVPTPTPTPQITQAPEASGSATYVWISATGKKYHSVNDCGTMNPDKATKLTEADAISQGYSACKKCY